MGIWEYKGDYFYGPRYYPEMSKRKGRIGLYTYLENKAKRYGFSKETPIHKAPDGDECPDEWHKSVPLTEIGSLSLPKNYPGDYYWVWYNGAFFKVMGETEKYVLVDIEECGYEQADALGIPREEVACDYHKEQNVGKWWLKKSEIKMPDEMGKGRYIYLSISNVFNNGVYEVVEKNGNKLRVRGMLLKEHDRIIGRIMNKLFPWNNVEMNKNARPEWWWEGEWIVFEATFDLKELKKYRSSEEHSAYDYYLYGEEKVPYRL